MEKYLLLLLTAIILNMGASAQFQPAAYQDYISPRDTNIARRAANTNCYTFGEVEFTNNSNNNLYVWTWDNAEWNVAANWGIGWKRTNITNPLLPISDSGSIVNSLNTDSMLGSDVVIVQSQTTDTVFVLVAYYSPALNTARLVYYRWLPTGLIYGGVLSLGAVADGSFSWIHIDAHDLNQFVVTWEANDKIYSRAGNTSGALPILNSTAPVQLSLPFAAHRPDVAIGEVTSSPLSVHFVYNNKQDTKVYVSSLPFNTIATSTGLITATKEDSLIGNAFGNPRIDCPDHFQGSDNWSIVVAESRRNMISSVKRLGFAPAHYFLNNGSLGNPNIAGFLNIRPAVAYDRDPRYINYAWALVDHPTLQSQYQAKVAYIGLRLRETGVLTSPNYWLVQKMPKRASVDSPAIALSCQNDKSPDQFASFTTIVDTFLYTVSVKQVPWNTNSFKPTEIEENMSKTSPVTVYPNPFGSSFSISVLNDDGKRIYNVNIIDLQGKKIKTYKGTLSRINIALQSIGTGITDGAYFVQIQNGDLKQQFKIIKQK